MLRTLLIVSILAVLAVIGWQSYAPREVAAPTYRTAPAARADVMVVVSATGTINPVTSVQVGSQISGIISRLHADFNTKVTKGMVLAELDPATGQAQVLQARANLEKARSAEQTAQANVLRDKAGVMTAKADIVASEANLEKSKAAVRIEEKNLARQKPLAAERLVAATEVDRTQSQRDQAAAGVSGAEAAVTVSRAKLASAEAGIASAGASVRAAENEIRARQAELEIAEINLSRTKIVSPVDGVVVSRSVDVGQTVAASLSAPVLFVIAKDLAEMQINTSIDEADIGKIQRGQSVRFTVDAYPDRHFEGRVREVRLGPIVNQNVVTYDCVVAVENPEHKLLPGMTANVSILVSRAEDALTVPAAALTFRPEGDDGAPRGRRGSGTGSGAPGAPGGRGSGQGSGAGGTGAGGRRDRSWVFARKRGDGGAQVFVLDKGQPKAVRVKTGLNDSRVVEITEGELTEGQEVIIGMETGGEKKSALGGSNPFSPARGGGGGRRMMR